MNAAADEFISFPICDYTIRYYYDYRFNFYFHFHFHLH